MAALPFPSWEEESGWLGGHEVKEQFVRGAAGELTSSVWRGSEAEEERGFVCVCGREGEGCKWDNKPLRGLVFSNNSMEIDY